MNLNFVARQIICITLLAAAMSLMADTETIGDYTWTYRINGDTAEIYNGGSKAAISPNPTGVVTIPSTLGGKPVTSIGAYAFYYCSGLTSVTMPDSVTSIGSSAFRDCSGLTSVTMPDSVTSIGSSAFRDCSGLTSVTMPNGVTSIGSSAFENTPFYNNQPDGLVVFGNIAYKMKGSCPDSVTIPYGVTSIGSSAFYNCSGLTNVTIPNRVECIGEGAFAYSGLTNLTIPNSVTIIGGGAFYKCQNLANVTIGNGLKVLVDGYSLSSDHIGNCGVFAECSSLTNVVFGNNMAHIGNYTFADCNNLICGTIPVSVTSIGPDSFYGCDKIWAEWFKTLANTSASGGSGSAGGGSPYALTNVAADRAIASVTVNDDCAIDSFVLKAGQVYDSVLRIVNTANRDVILTLPTGHVYETFEGVNPLKIPANSTNILTITRTEANTFLVSREKLKTIQ